MKKILISLGIALLVILGVLYALGSISGAVLADKTDYFMARHLTEYMSQHDLVAPPSWEVFLDWCKETGNDATLPPLDQLQRFFDLPTGKVSVGGHVIVHARIRKMRKHADQINRQIDWERLQEEEESNNQIQATGVPPAPDL